MSTKTKTARRIRQFIEQELLDGDSGPDDLIGMGVLDSLAIEQLIAFVEETFAVTLDDGDFVPENFQSADAVAALVDRKHAARK